MTEQTVSIHLDGGQVLSVGHEGQWLTSTGPQPDPVWRTRDSHGHEHHYADAINRYPTLQLVSGEPYWCDGCCDEHRDTWYECRQCHDKITPGTRIDHNPKWIAGPTYYSLDGEPISEDEARPLIDAARRRADEAVKIHTRPPIGTRVRYGTTIVTVVPTPDATPDTQIAIMHSGSGTIEVVDLYQLRKSR